MNKPLWMAATATAYILGIATGILLVKERMARKYRKLADAEVESVKEAFNHKAEQTETEWKEEVKKAAARREEEAKRINEIYKNLLETHKYAPEEEEDAVYISPDEYGDEPDYESATVIFYEASGVFVEDDTGIPLDDEEWESMLGCGVAKQFGKYEDDRVCVRNDKRKKYYEVLLEEGEYEP